jgi:predicted nucleic acid-binding protein
MKIVLDTNVLIAGIFWGGTPGQIITAWEKNAFEVVVTEPVLAEYEPKLKSKQRADDQ